MFEAGVWKELNLYMEFIWRATFLWILFLDTHIQMFASAYLIVL